MASRASPCRAGAGGWSGASMASLPPRRAALVVVIRHVQGVRCPHGAGSGGGDPARLGRPLPSRCAGAGMIRAASRASPSAMAAGAGDGGGVPVYGGIVIVNTLYWNMVLSTSNDNRARNSTRFLRKRKLAKFFSRKRQLAKFFMGDLCVNTNQH